MSDIDIPCWEESDWEEILLAIKHKQCTPFLGAGACFGVLPTGRSLSVDLATKYGYPFEDNSNLLRVAQYISVQSGPNTPRYVIVDKFTGKGPPDFSNPHEPHRVVADFDLPVYITTNYDDFMMRALQRDRTGSLRKRPRREICRWNQKLSRIQSVFDTGFEPTPEEPLVFHLHGVLDNVSSMVLTEDDYLDFLMNISEDPQLIPPRIQRAFAESSLLFLGYSLEDMNFKVLFRRLAAYMDISGARHVSVQLAPGNNGSVPTEEQIRKVDNQRKYLEKHFNLQKVRVYWGTCEQFVADLHIQWEKLNERNS